MRARSPASRAHARRSRSTARPSPSFAPARFASELLFLERQRHVGLYQTPYGMATIATHTSRIQNTIGEGGGALVIDYTVEIDHSVAGSHHFEMTVATQPFVQ